MLELYRPSLRAAGAIAVLLAWLASLGWLGVRRLHQTEETTLTSEASLRLAPGTVWYAVYAGGTPVGTAAIALDTLSPGYRISETVMLETPSGTGLARASRLSKVWLGTAMNVQRMESRYSREGRTAEWSVVVLGDTVTARFGSAELRTQGQLRFAEPPTASLAIPYRLALGGGLAPGRGRVVRMMDGWPLGAPLARISVGRDSLLHFADSSRTGGPGGHWIAVHNDSVRALSVTIVGAGSPRRLWIDHRGAVSGMDTPFGLRWVRTDFDLSETEFRRALPERTEAIRDAIPAMAQFAATSWSRDSSTEERHFLVAHRDGTPVDTALLALLAGGRQSVHGDTLIVRSWVAGARGESVRDTVPDPMIQHDALAIANALRGLGIDSTGLDPVADLLTACHALARVDTSAAAPEDALGTLGNHGGRPDGIARLFVALLRASGVPARYVVGVYPQGDSLLTHAWVEVWPASGTGWRAVDPVSGHNVANTGLIRLAIGGSSHPDEMLATLANARLTELGRKGKR